LLSLIDQEIQASRAELARDLIRLIGIKSVQGEPLPGAPFGSGPKMMLDEALRMGHEAGFYTADYGCGVVSLALKPGQPDLGI
jgi:succinyl-diaminopimelate desuccinylase